MVADEVRNLAHRAQESAQQIQKMIEELQVGAREAVATMTESQRYSLESVETRFVAEYSIQLSYECVSVLFPATCR